LTNTKTIVKLFQKMESTTASEFLKLPSPALLLEAWAARAACGRRREAARFPALHLHPDPTTPRPRSARTCSGRAALAGADRVRPSSSWLCGGDLHPLAARSCGRPGRHRPRRSLRLHAGIRWFLPEVDELRHPGGRSSNTSRRCSSSCEEGKLGDLLALLTTHRIDVVRFGPNRRRRASRARCSIIC